MDKKQILLNIALKMSYAKETGQFFIKKFEYLGNIGLLLAMFFKQALKRPFFTRELKDQCLQMGLFSMPIASITLFFVGVVFAFQFGFTLKTFGAQGFIGRVTSISLLRELGPVFTALVVGGRIGAGMAAEIGAMRVSEQIDAITALGANPVKKLIVPRILAATFMLPLVTVLSTIIGALGAIMIAWFEFKVSPMSFYGSSMAAVRMSDFLSGFCKTFFFGFGVALVGCHEGLNCNFGTKGVGDATTRAVVNVSLVIVFTDFFLTRLFAIIL